MKKLIIVFSLIGMIGLSSCKQDWVCQCVQADGTVNNTPINGGTFIHAERTCRDINKNCSLITESR